MSDGKLLLLLLLERKKERKNLFVHLNVDMRIVGPILRLLAAAAPGIERPSHYHANYGLQKGQSTNSNKTGQWQWQWQ